MRLICTIDPTSSQEDAMLFSSYLTAQGLVNECQTVMLEQGVTNYRIWVYDEDSVAKAIELYQNYQKNPQNPCYNAFKTTSQNTPTQEQEPVAPQRRSVLSATPYRPITVFLIFSTILLFIWAQLGRDRHEIPKLPGIIEAPVLSPIERALIFDDPQYFTLRDKLFQLYTPEQIKEHQAPSAEAQTLLYTLSTTPVWMGLYDRVVDNLQHKTPPSSETGDFMLDIRQGQLWRLVTPALLHFDFLHIFFNLLWFILLGNQIEYRIGSLRYGALVIFIAVISNVGQYLMSGPFFMGLSGVVCGLAAFIWARQCIAPWEGYLLHRFTLLFLAFFVVGIFLLQIAFFCLQVFGHMDLNIGIANTAHLVGAAAGYGLGRMRRFFAIHKKIES